MRFLGTKRNVEISGTVEGLKEKLRSFMNELPDKNLWISKTKEIIFEFTKHKNCTFVCNLSNSVAGAFANLLPEQLQRLGTALVDEGCKAAHTQAGGTGWHGRTTSSLTNLTGLANSSVEVGMDRIEHMHLEEEKEVLKEVDEAAELFAGNVREVFARVQAVDRTVDGGVSPRSVQIFVNRVKVTPGLYGKALEAVKELQKLWRLYFPNSNGVLLFPMKRKRWRYRFSNSNFTSYEDLGKTTSWENWFLENLNGKKTLNEKPRVRFSSANFLITALNRIHFLI